MGDCRAAQETLEAEFERFRDHCIIIRRDYNTYYQLFFSDSDELLKKVAGHFFNDISEIMLRDWILQVCKLMDRKAFKVGGLEFETISVELINSRLKDVGAFTDGLRELSKAILSYGKKLIPARNKRIAHLDKEYAFSDEMLGVTSVEELEEFLKNIQLYCDEVGRAIDVGPLDFSCSSGPGDVLDLIKILEMHYEVPEEEVGCLLK